MKSYPAVKLCRLAVSNEAKSLHIGTDLLNYIKIFFTNNNKTGCRFLTVDAYIKSLGFYIKNGFAFLNPSEEEQIKKAAAEAAASEAEGVQEAEEVKKNNLKTNQTCLLYFDLNDVLRN